LGVSLTLGLVLVAKVYFEQTYENFYPDVDRIFRIEENYSVGDTKDQTHGGVSGAIAHGMKMEIPEIEAATRLDLMSEQIFYDKDRRKFTGEFVMGDADLFDLLPRPMIVGSAEVLGRPMSVMLSESLAKKINPRLDQLIGEVIQFDNFPGRQLTIGGIFKDIPENTTLTYDAVVSLVSFRELWGWDCLDNWMGCDRFMGFVKLYPGVDAASLQPAIRSFQERHHDIEELTKAGVELNYVLKSFQSYHITDRETKNRVLLLTVIAFALIFTGVMNYVLIVISTMVGRTKEVAVNKCFGASGKDITGIVLSETFVHLLLSVLLAICMVVASRSLIMELLTTSLTGLFTLNAIILVIGVLIMVFFVAGLLPSWLLVRIPIAAAFRSYKESKRLWKLALLFIQVVAAGFLVTFLVIINNQYNLMVNQDPGYEYNKLIYTELRGVNGSERQRVKDELMRLSIVDDVTSCDELMLWGCSGNNVYFVDRDEELFNINDMQSVDANFFEMLNIPIIEGRGFADGNTQANSIMVSRSCAERLVRLSGWTDGVVGKTILVSGGYQGPQTIIGVYENIIFGDISDPRNQKPSLATSRKFPGQYFLIKMREMSPENTEQVQALLQTLLPTKEIIVNNYEAGFRGLYKSSHLFRNSVLIGGIATLLISLIGLIGYTQDEVNRRSAEVAVRKINGAEIVDIEKIFLFDILYMSVPALILGGIGAFYASRIWLENFAVKTSLSFFIFLIAAILVLLIILLVAAVDCYRAATANPVDSLKKE
ncbi:MAG: ABC transporter permease, partial [Tannerellaceae bacterium]|nr:ABC transporter permease [Tannerellaceae bacterium]